MQEKMVVVFGFAFISALLATSSIAAEKTTRQQVQEVLEHFKQKDPLGIPGAPVPDPLEVEEFQEKFGLVRLKFKKAKAYKLSKFKIDYVTIDLHSLEASMGVLVPEVDLKGEYEMLSLFSKSKGAFTVNLKDVYAEGKTKMIIADNSKTLTVNKIDLDMSFKHIKLNFENLGYMARVFQGIMNSVGATVFNTIKPIILNQIDETVVTELNNALKEIPFEFTQSSAPIDVALQHASRMARDMKYDPYPVPSQQIKSSLLSMNTSGMVIYGLSKVQRGEHIVVRLRNNTVEAKVEFATEELKGSTKYSAKFLENWPFDGEFAFEVDYVKVGVFISQPLNLNEKMTLKDIELEIGRVKIKPLGEGSGSIPETILQFTVALISGTVRNLLICVAEEPIRAIVQDILSEVDLEKIVYDNI